MFPAAMTFQHIILRLDGPFTQGFLRLCLDVLDYLKTGLTGCYQKGRVDDRWHLHETFASYVRRMLIRRETGNERENGNKSLLASYP